MTEAIAFPDVESLLVAYLEPLLGVQVSTKVPNPRPASFVRLVRVGGSRRDLVTDQPLVTFEAWASDETVAADLAKSLRAYVYAVAQTSVGSDYVRAVREAGGLASFPDPESKLPRYVFTAQLDTRGAPLP